MEMQNVLNVFLTVESYGIRFYRNYGSLCKNTFQWKHWQVATMLLEIYLYRVKCCNEKHTAH